MSQIRANSESGASR